MARGPSPRLTGNESAGARQGPRPLRRCSEPVALCFSSWITSKLAADIYGAALLRDQFVANHLHKQTLNRALAYPGKA
jgi:hypothetical protein